MKTITQLSKAFCFLAFATFVQFAHAQKDPDLKTETEFKNYRVQHVVFNSTFIQESVAMNYGLKRSKYESLLNISVYDKNSSKTIATVPAKITGTVKNLMQQQKSLEIIEIKEKDTIYYLAPIKIANEELLHFELNITPEGGEALNVKFSQTVYADE